MEAIIIMATTRVMMCMPTHFHCVCTHLCEQISQLDVYFSIIFGDVSVLVDVWFCLISVVKPFCAWPIYLFLSRRSERCFTGQPVPSVLLADLWISKQRWAHMKEYIWTPYVWTYEYSSTTSSFKSIFIDTAVRPDITCWYFNKYESV